MTFFQNDTKFVVGDCYQFIRVTTDYNRHARENGESFESWLARSDEVGDILPNPPVFLGKYVRSQHVGDGDADGRTRDDYFRLKGAVRANRLLYDGTTRYRKVNCDGSQIVPIAPIVENEPKPVPEYIAKESYANFMRRITGKSPILNKGGKRKTRKNKKRSKTRSKRK